MAQNTSKKAKKIENQYRELMFAIESLERRLDWTFSRKEADELREKIAELNAEQKRLYRLRSS